MDKKTLKQSVIHKIMDRAIEINKACAAQCRDFQIMLSQKRKNTLILRWTTIDISNEDNPVQCYRYECFKTDGIRNCVPFTMQTKKRLMTLSGRWNRFTINNMQ